MPDAIMCPFRETAIPPRFVSERAIVLAMFARWERDTLGRATPNRPTG
jgi:hypothetical protein